MLRLFLGIIEIVEEIGFIHVTSVKTKSGNDALVNVVEIQPVR